MQIIPARHWGSRPYTTSDSAAVSRNYETLHQRNIRVVLSNKANELWYPEIEKSVSLRSTPVEAAGYSESTILMDNEETYRWIIITLATVYIRYEYRSLPFQFMVLCYSCWSNQVTGENRLPSWYWWNQISFSPPLWIRIKNVGRNSRNTLVPIWLYSKSRAAINHYT